MLTNPIPFPSIHGTIDIYPTLLGGITNDASGCRALQNLYVDGGILKNRPGIKLLGSLNNAIMDEPVVGVLRGDVYYYSSATKCYSVDLSTMIRTEISGSTGGNSMAVIGEQVIVSSSTGTSRINSTGGFYNNSIAVPVVSSVTVVSGAGLQNGYYSVCCTYSDTSGLFESAPSEVKYATISSSSSAQIQVVVPGSSDSQVSKINFYLSLPGSSTMFYHSQVDNAVGNISVTISTQSVESSRDAKTDYVPMHSGTQCCVGGHKLFVSDGDTLYWSLVNVPGLSFNSYFQKFNATISVIYPYNDYIICFLTNDRVWAVNVFSFSSVEIEHRTGILSGSIQVFDNYLVFLDKNLEFMAFDGTRVSSMKSNFKITGTYQSLSSFIISQLGLYAVQVKRYGSKEMYIMGKSMYGFPISSFVCPEVYAPVSGGSVVYAMVYTNYGYVVCSFFDLSTYIDIGTIPIETKFSIDMSNSQYFTVRKLEYNYQYISKNYINNPLIWAYLLNASFNNEVLPVSSYGDVAFASSTNGTHLVSLIFDFSPTTYWESEEKGITFEYGDYYDLMERGIYPMYIGDQFDELAVGMMSSYSETESIYFYPPKSASPEWPINIKNIKIDCPPNTCRDISIYFSCFVDFSVVDIFKQVECPTSGTISVPCDLPGNVSRFRIDVNSVWSGSTAKISNISVLGYDGDTPLTYLLRRHEVCPQNGIVYTYSTDRVSDINALIDQWKSDNPTWDDNFDIDSFAPGIPVNIPSNAIIEPIDSFPEKPFYTGDESVRSQVRVYADGSETVNQTVTDSSGKISMSLTGTGNINRVVAVQRNVTGDFTLNRAVIGTILVGSSSTSGSKVNE